MGIWKIPTKKSGGMTFSHIPLHVDHSVCYNQEILVRKLKNEEQQAFWEPFKTIFFHLLEVNDYSNLTIPEKRLTYC